MDSYSIPIDDGILTANGGKAMQINQNDMEHLKDMMQQGKMPADEANIRKVEMQRVLLCVGTIPASVRKALNSGVKSGRLEHKKRDGKKPEVYYKKGFEHLANAERNQYERDCIKAISGVCI
jgi:hypothetical protein